MQNTSLDIEKVGKILPFIKDKMVIDFVNGLDIANKLNQNNHAVSQNFIKRNLYLLSGKQQISQNNINDHVIKGLEACQAYFKEIASHQQAHANAIITLHNTLKTTQIHMAEIVNYVVDLQKQVNDINRQLTSRVDKLELSDKANRQVDNVLSAWQAEKYIELSPMAQCFVVLDTLKWGDFGLYLNQLNDTERQQHLETLKNKVIIVQKNLLNKNADESFLKREWLTPTNKYNENEDLKQALQFQGDWSWNNPKKFAMAFTATQLPMLSQSEANQYKDLVVSMIDINRVSERMMNNVFSA